MWKKIFKEESGSILIIAALSITILLGFCALVVDIGRIDIEKSKMQNAVDASTLAASLELPDINKATETANNYIKLNGYDPSNISISFSDSNNKIKLIGTKDIDFSFGKALGLYSTKIVQSSMGMKETIGDAFEYALFSGDTSTSLSLNGSTFNITGSTHSNQRFTLNCSNAAITGACEAVTGISINGSVIKVFNRISNASVISMPDFSDSIKLKAENDGQVYYGNKTFSSSDVLVDNSIYVNGNVTFNASSFKGQGTICSTGSITFNGSSINATSQDAVCFYSKNGSININGSNVTIEGILYAPQGSININASSVNINGRVIGKKLSINASSINIVSGAKDLKSLPSSSAKLVE